MVEGPTLRELKDKLYEIEWQEFVEKISWDELRAESKDIVDKYGTVGKSPYLREEHIPNKAIADVLGAVHPTPITKFDWAYIWLQMLFPVFVAYAILIWIVIVDL